MRLDIWKEKREQAQVLECGLKVYKVVSPTNKLVLVIFKPKALRPFINYWLETEDQREKYLQLAIKNHLEHANRVKERRENSKISVNSDQLKKGDIFETSWGYDQTNYDFIAVLGISPSGKRVLCQRTSSLHMGTSSQCNVQEPIFQPFGEKFYLIPYGDNGHIGLKGSYPFLHTGEGSKRMGYFSKVRQGEQFHETDSIFGH